MSNFVVLKRTQSEIDVFGGDVYIDIDGKNAGIVQKQNLYFDLSVGKHTSKMYKSHTMGTFIGVSETEIDIIEGEKLYAIIEDRCESILTHAGVFRADKHNTITKKLRRLEWLTQRDKLAGKYFSKELIDSIFEWKEKRNKFIHTLTKQVFTGEELGEIVMQGQTIAKTLSSKSTSYRRALERQNR